ncbi:unnamed protein product, partial [Vitis vinifera]
MSLKEFCKRFAKYFPGESSDDLVYLINRCPTSAIGFKTPQELWTVTIFVDEEDPKSSQELFQRNGERQSYVSNVWREKGEFFWTYLKSDRNSHAAKRFPELAIIFSLFSIVIRFGSHVVEFFGEFSVIY